MNAADSEREQIGIKRRCLVGSASSEEVFRGVQLGGRKYPRLQIIMIENALHGEKPAIPLVDTGAAFKRATRENAEQPKLVDRI